MNGFLISPAYASRPGLFQRQKNVRNELKMAGILHRLKESESEIQESVTVWREELQVQRLGGHILNAYSDQLMVLGAIHGKWQSTFIFDLRRHMDMLPQSLWEMTRVTHQTFRNVACLVDVRDEAMLERCGIYVDAGTSVAELNMALRESNAIVMV